MLSCRCFECRARRQLVNSQEIHVDPEPRWPVVLNRTAKIIPSDLVRDFVERCRDVASVVALHTDDAQFRYVPCVRFTAVPAEGRDHYFGSATRGFNGGTTGFFGSCFVVPAPPVGFPLINRVTVRIKVSRRRRHDSHPERSVDGIES